MAPECKVYRKAHGVRTIGPRGCKPICDGCRDGRRRRAAGGGGRRRGGRSGGYQGSQGASSSSAPAPRRSARIASRRN